MFVTLVLSTSQEGFNHLIQRLRLRIRKYNGLIPPPLLSCCVRPVKVESSENDRDFPFLKYTLLRVGFILFLFSTRDTELHEEHVTWLQSQAFESPACQNFKLSVQLNLPPFVPNVLPRKLL